MKIRMLKDIEHKLGTLKLNAEFYAEISDNKLVANVQIDGQPFPLMIGRDCEIVRPAAATKPPDTERESLRKEFYAHAVLELAKANRIARPNAASSEVIGVAKADADAYIKAIGL